MQFIHPYPKLKNRVVIIQKYIPRYRLSFFSRLRDVLAANSIELILIYGHGDQVDKTKKDAIELSWGYCVPVRIINIFYGQFYWQNAIPLIQKNDLVIVEQANRMLLNYVLLFRRIFKRDIKIAFWGHGINRKLLGNSHVNKFKLLVTGFADWWFAYTKGVKETLIEGGLPSDKITAVQNTIDTDSLLKKMDQATYPGDMISAASRDSKYGIFVGSMYKEKQIPFLIEACQRVKEKIPEFKMIFIGAGADKEYVEAFAENNSWVYCFGPLFEDDKIPYLKLADVLLIPRAVGLVVIDSFVTQTPIVTTKTLGHGPEIEYLKSGHNSIITSDTIGAYANAVVNILQNEQQLNLLKEECASSAKTFSLDNMVRNFAQGVTKAINL